MAIRIIPSASNLAALLDRPAKPQTGRTPAPYRINELAPVINKNPDNYHERESRVKAMRRSGYLVPINEELEFLCLEPDDNDSTPAYDVFQQLNWS